MKRLCSVLLVLAAALLVAACGTSDDGDASAQATPQSTTTPVAAAPTILAPTVTATRPVLPATVTDKDGRSVTVTDVSRIIPLNGDIAEVIWALGLGDNVVATDTSATYPEAATTLPRIGYQRQLSAEGVLSLRPTVVIGNENAGPPAVIEQIRGAGVPVVILPVTTTLEGVPGKIRDVATTLGVVETGQRVAAQTQSEIDAAKTLAATATSTPRVAFLYLRGASTQQIGGTGSSADALITAAGGVDAGTTAGIRGFQPITAEALVTARPDVLLLLSAGLESVGGRDGLLTIPGIAQTPAGQNRRILDYEDQYLLGLGPRAGQALMEIVKGIHPELK
ncbi:MAG: heme/hemin ABC transporter substrate-binding protein [Dehalococcoidia bacterium]